MWCASFFARKRYFNLNFNEMNQYCRSMCQQVCLGSRKKYIKTDVFEMKKFKNKTKTNKLLYSIANRMKKWERRKVYQSLLSCCKNIFEAVFLLLSLCVWSKKLVISQLSYTLFISEKCLQRRWLGFASFPLVSCNIFPTHFRCVSSKLFASTVSYFLDSFYSLCLLFSSFSLQTIAFVKQGSYSILVLTVNQLNWKRSKERRKKKLYKKHRKKCFVHFCVWILLLE